MRGEVVVGGGGARAAEEGGEPEGVQVHAQLRREYQREGDVELVKQPSQVRRVLVDSGLGNVDRKVLPWTRFCHADRLEKGADESYRDDQEGQKLLNYVGIDNGGNFVLRFLEFGLCFEFFSFASR